MSLNELNRLVALKYSLPPVAKVGFIFIAPFLSVSFFLIGHINAYVLSGPPLLQAGPLRRPDLSKTLMPILSPWTIFQDIPRTIQRRSSQRPPLL